MNVDQLLPQISSGSSLDRRPPPFDLGILPRVQEIIDQIRLGGDETLKSLAEVYDQWTGPLCYSRGELETSFDSLPPTQQDLLQRVAGRIRSFAQQQRDSLGNLDTAVDGGRASHRWIAMESAGCYAPGGRFAYPSSVLMTVIPARVAGVKECIVASPRPTPITLGAAAVAGADSVIASGGAQGIAALAFGTSQSAACDVIVGPGNQWVTAAKFWLSRETRIDFLAGPSELVVCAEESSNAEWVAADLLAQAEHGPDSLVVLLARSNEFVKKVRKALCCQLEQQPEPQVAQRSLEQGFAIVVSDDNQVVSLCNEIAPEHLSWHGNPRSSTLDSLRNYGALFVGEHSAEVFCDYGLGPNHVLPTGGRATQQGGLSVLHFLKLVTQLHATDQPVSSQVIQDTIAMAELEGLSAHANAAALRLKSHRKVSVKQQGVGLEDRA